MLIKVERSKKLYTLNQQFSVALSEARGHKMTELLRARARKDTTQYNKVQYIVNLSDITRAAEGKSNMEQLQEAIHNILHAYYSLAANQFINNIFQLTVNYNLLHSPSSPLNVFSHKWVLNLKPKTLKGIVSKPKSLKKHRSRLVKKIEDLINALKILKS